MVCFIPEKLNEEFVYADMSSTMSGIIQPLITLFKRTGGSFTKQYNLLRFPQNIIMIKCLIGYKPDSFDNNQHNTHEVLNVQK